MFIFILTNMSVQVLVNYIGKKKVSSYCQTSSSVLQIKPMVSDQYKELLCPDPVAFIYKLILILVSNRISATQG